MSVIIKGEDMPNRCADCTCCFSDDNDDRSFCSVYGDDIPDIFNGRLDGCPLVELHEDHGRLIDADAFENKLKRLSQAQDPYQSGVAKAILMALSSAPTVIEEGV